MADGGGFQIVQPTVNPQAGLGQLAQAMGGYAVIPQELRSQYLADALQQMRSEGNNIKSPTALWSNLAAEALDQYGLSRSNAKLIKQLGASQAGLANNLFSAATGPANTSPASSAPPAEAGSPPASPDAGGLAEALFPQADVAQGVAQAATSGNTPTDLTTSGGIQAAIAQAAQRHNVPIPLAESVAYAESRFRPNAVSPAGAQGVMQLMPQTAAGLGVNSGDVGQNIDGGVNYLGQQLARFHDPRLAAAAYNAGPGRVARAGGVPNIGETQAYVQQVMGNMGRFANMGGQSTATANQAVPAPMPSQISTGPDPSVASPGAGGPAGASAPVGASASASRPTPPPAVPPAGGGAQFGGPPASGLYATPQERQMMAAYLSQPQGSALYMQGLAMAQEIAHRASAPIAMKENFRWDPASGQEVMNPGLSDRLVGYGPAGGVTVGPDGKYASFSNPNAGPVPAGGMLGTTPGGGAQFMPYGATQPRPLTDPGERAKFGILPSDRNSYAIGPDGKITKTADNPYGPTQIQSVHDNFWGSDETKKSQEATSAFTGFVGALNNARVNNGPLDQAAMDSFLRGINPGMGARNSTVQMVMEHFGFPQELQGHISSLLGNGFITPAILQQMGQITHDYAMAHRTVALSRAQQDAKMVAPFGYGPSDLAEDLPPIPAMPTVQFSGAPQAAPAGNAPPAPNPYVAELIRRGYRQVNGQWVKP